VLCGERPQQHGRQIDHTHARKRSRHLTPPLSVRRQQ
jgi:hypothetical protein